MKKILLILCCLVLAGMAACGPNNAPGETSASSVQPQASGETASSASGEEQPASPEDTAKPGKVSLTTGLPSEKEYKPVGVMIENADGARPQTGLQAADIVYEVLSEANITRFFCIYNDKMPKKVGPVRSVRIYYINIQKEWDSILVHYGGPSTGKVANVYAESTEYIKIRVNGLKGAYGKYFWRTDDKKSPHNVLTDLTKIQSLYDYTPNARKPWAFKSEAAYAPEEPFVKTIHVPFISSENFITYSYDKEKDVFKRAMGGKPFTDTETDKAVEVKNIIVQYAKQYDLDEGKGRRMVEVTGSGKAEFFVGGKHLTGTWERKDLDAQTVYKDSTGAEITLRPGNTWIEVHPNTKEIKVDYE